MRILKMPLAATDRGGGLGSIARRSRQFVDPVDPWPLLIHDQRFSVPEHLIASTSGGIQTDLDRSLQLEYQRASACRELHPVSPTTGELQCSGLSHNNLQHPLGLGQGTTHQLKPLLRCALLNLLQGPQGSDALIKTSRGRAAVDRLDISSHGLQAETVAQGQILLLAVDPQQAEAITIA